MKSPRLDVSLPIDEIEKYLKIAEHDKLHAEAKHQGSLNGYYGIRAIFAGIMAGISIFFLHANLFALQRNALMDQNNSLVQQSKDLSAMIEVQAANLSTLQADVAAERMKASQLEVLLADVKRVKQETQAKDAKIAELNARLRKQLPLAKSDPEKESAAKLEQELVRLQAQKEQDLARQVQLELQLERARQPAAQCSRVARMITKADAAADSWEVVLRAVFKKHQPYAGFSDDLGRARDAASLLGLEARAGKPLARISAAPQQVVFTDRGIYFGTDGASEISYESLAAAAVSIGKENITVGSARISLADTLYQPAKMKDLLTEISVLRVACPNL